MEVKIIAETDLGHVPTKEELDKIGGLAAGVCYLPDTIEKLFAEDERKTARRAEMIKHSGHHSPFDHATITLQFDNIPKILAMVLNNEKMYTASEKSARYKRMALPEDEQFFYDKWLKIFSEQLKQEQSKCPEWLTDKKIVKLSQENARYLTSVFTPTSMVYTLSYRQFNIIYSLLGKEIDILESEKDIFSEKLRQSLIELRKQFEDLNILDSELSDNRKNRNLSLFRRNDKAIIKQAGEVYCISYEGSFAELAQAQRHRTINYSLNLSSVENHQFFVPEILKNDEKLVKMWVEDCATLQDKFPQGTKVVINESGTLDDFKLKALERECTQAQWEIDHQTRQTAKELYEMMQDGGHPRAEELKPLLNGSRCTFGYVCTDKCKYAEGVKGTRKF